MSDIQDVQHIALDLRFLHEYAMSSDARSVLLIIANSVMVFRRQTTVDLFPQSPSYVYVSDIRSPVIDPFACKEDTCALINVNETALALLSVPLLSQQLGRNMSLLSVLSLPVSLLPPASSAPSLGFAVFTSVPISATSMVIRIAAPVVYSRLADTTTVVVWESSPLPLTSLSPQARLCHPLSGR